MPPIFEELISLDIENFGHHYPSFAYIGYGYGTWVRS